MARRVVVILNAASRKAEREGLQAALAAAGLDADVREASGPGIAQEARAAAKAKPDAIVAAGGDGTVNAVAGAIVGTGIPLGVLPLGTLNHFARDLRVPLDLLGAARVLAEGEPRAIDVGEVNGRLFVNNSSIGIYPEIVREREAQQESLGRGKWAAFLVATWRVMRRFPRLFVIVDLKDRVLARSTPFVFVGNNRYEARLTAPGTRSRLDAGELSVLTAHDPTRWGVLRMLFGALLRPGPEPRAPGLDLATRPEVVVDARKRALRVALDGEVVEMRPPLRYRVRPGGLRILAPGGGAA